MGSSLVTEPTITRWCIKSNDLDHTAAIIATHDPGLAKTHHGSRVRTDGSLLEWDMILPQAAPLVELVPFAVEWGTSIHPTATLPNFCQLDRLELRHPNPAIMQKLLRDLQIDIAVIEADDIVIKCWIRCPNGIIEI